MLGLLLTNAYSSSEGQKYQCDRLVAEFAKLDVELVPTRNFVTAHIEGGNVATSLPSQADFVVYLDKDVHIAKMLETAGFRLFNSAESIEACDDKMTTQLLLANRNIAMPNTIMSPLCYAQSHSAYDVELLDYVEAQLGYPIVVKECYGSFGKQVYLASDRNELNRIRKKLRNVKHLYQQFVSTSYGFDTRVIVIGGKVFSYMRRVNRNDFRSNIELGGVGEICQPPESYIKCAEECASALKLDYCGVDILSGENGQPLVCEVNSNAYFRGMERVTGKNVAERYAQHILSQIK